MAGDGFLYMDVTMEDYFVNLASFISSGLKQQPQSSDGSRFLWLMERGEVPSVTQYNHREK